MGLPPGPKPIIYGGQHIQVLRTSYVRTSVTLSGASVHPTPTLFHVGRAPSCVHAWWASTSPGSASRSPAAVHPALLPRSVHYPSSPLHYRSLESAPVFEPTQAASGQGISCKLFTFTCTSLRMALPPSCPRRWHLNRRAAVDEDRHIYTFMTGDPGSPVTVVISMVENGRCGRDRRPRHAGPGPTSPDTQTLQSAFPLSNAHKF